MEVATEVWYTELAHEHKGWSYKNMRRTMTITIRTIINEQASWMNKNYETMNNNKNYETMNNNMDEREQNQEQ